LLYIYAGVLDILRFDKISTDLKCFIFQFGGAELTNSPPGDGIG